MRKHVYGMLEQVRLKLDLLATDVVQYHRVQPRMISVDIFFAFLRLLFCAVLLLYVT